MKQTVSEVNGKSEIDFSKKWQEELAFNASSLTFTAMNKATTCGRNICRHVSQFFDISPPYCHHQGLHSYYEHYCKERPQ